MVALIRKATKDPARATTSQGFPAAEENLIDDDVDISAIVPVVQTRTEPEPSLRNVSYSEALKDQGSEISKTMESKHHGSEMEAKFPNDDPLDESYITTPAGLNSLLFSPNSEFCLAVVELQGTSGFQIEPWKIHSNKGCLRRTITYINSASKLVKACKATEEQKILESCWELFRCSVYC